MDFDLWLLLLVFILMFGIGLGDPIYNEIDVD
jgi:hypothetical protein